ncbi:MAG: cytochrome c [Deltaproteobacteria bacterium]|nr:cytochrome c [Deltaproteobacteria bacterium]
MRTRVMTAVVTAAAVAFVCTPVARAEDVKETFTKNCTMCHGADLKGQTKVGQLRKIPDLTAADVRAKFDRSRMIKSVTEGVKDEDTGKEHMRAFGAKLSGAEIAALVDYVISGAK